MPVCDFVLDVVVVRHSFSIYRVVYRLSEESVLSELYFRRILRALACHLWAFCTTFYTCSFDITGIFASVMIDVTLQLTARVKM